MREVGGGTNEKENVPRVAPRMTKAESADVRIDHRDEFL